LVDNVFVMLDKQSFEELLDVRISDRNIMSLFKLKMAYNFFPVFPVWMLDSVNYN